MTLRLLLLLVTFIACCQSNVPDNRQSAAKICESLHINFLYYNYRQYKECIDDIRVILTESSSDGKSLGVDMTKVANHWFVDKSTTVWAFQTLYAAKWYPDSIGLLFRRIKSNKSLDHISKKHLVKKIHGYGHHIWWLPLLKLSDAEEIRFNFLKYLDVILENDGFKEPIAAYLKWHAENVKTKNRNFCNINTLMLLFKFFTEFNEKEHSLGHADYEAIYDCVCSPDQNWNFAHLTNVLLNDKMFKIKSEELKSLLKHIHSEVPGLQVEGKVGEYWGIQDVIDKVTIWECKDDKIAAQLHVIKCCADLKITPITYDKMITGMKAHRIPVEHFFMAVAWVDGFLENNKKYKPEFENEKKTVLFYERVSRFFQLGTYGHTNLPYKAEKQLKELFDYCVTEKCSGEKLSKGMKRLTTGFFGYILYKFGIF